MKCPSCNGEKETFAHVNTRDPNTHGFRYIPCMTCGGSGEIDENHSKRIAYGRAARDARIRAGKTLRQVADERGISVVDLSRFEHGLLTVGEESVGAK